MIFMYELEVTKLAQTAKAGGMDMKMPMSMDDKDTMKREEKMPVGKGKVVDIDSKAGKVTLAHEPIPDLGWPAMTMGFQVKDAKQLADIKAGDTVEFDLKADPKTEQYNIEHITKQGDKPNAMKLGEKP